VLVLGATGSSGQLALQVARHLGAGRVVVAGRNPAALDALVAAGADAAVSLAGSDDEVIAALQTAGGKTGYDVVLDYLWGKPFEILAASLMGGGVDYTRKQTRLVQVGSMAGPDATLPANVLRSTGLRVMGSGAGSVDPREIVRMIPEVWKLAAAATLHMEIEEVPLAEVEAAWQRGDRDGRRQVVRISG
jgi:NADPH2:quinone reductase